MYKDKLDIIYILILFLALQPYKTKTKLCFIYLTSTNQSHLVSSRLALFVYYVLDTILNLIIMFHDRLRTLMWQA